ncbi:MAG: response regulator [Alphaproteobacteria bacterium]|nr:response regulator [Alphaproteobacteria bacterium]
MKNRDYLSNGKASLIQTAKPRKVLIVEDDRSSLMYLEQQLEGLGYEPIALSNGKSACELLERNPDAVDAMILDQILPGMNGIDLIRRFRSDSRLRSKPMIMLTGCDSPGQIKEGLDAGVFYYLIKPVDVTVLQSIMSAAMRRAELNKHLLQEAASRQTAMSCASNALFQVRTLDEADNVAALVSSCFPEPDRAVVGISELLVNAIEHGNLEIGYERKSELIENGTWHSEIEQRLDDPQYSGRKASVSVKKNEKGVYISITDQGNGFDPARFLALDAERASQRNGRGIANARCMSFDKLGYNKKGNQVVGFAHIGGKLEW